MKLISIAFSFLLLCSCSKTTSSKAQEYNSIKATSIVVLGTIQDAGSPQIGCHKSCCIDLFQHPDNSRKVVSLGVIDTSNDRSYLFEASPDMVEQMKMLSRYNRGAKKEFADGIFLTHAHIGHYTGLMYLGKEATDAKKVPVFAMPRMKTFLTNNGPWHQLVLRENIILNELKHEQGIQLSKDLEVTPFLVPHRDEYSETVGYKIKGPRKTALFIPDIDKWSKWEKNIIDEIKRVDYAFLDATFYSGREINNRDISQIPHPFIIESLQTFKDLSREEKSKIIFIHFNHTNPVIQLESEAAKSVLEKGFNIARINDVYEL